MDICKNRANFSRTLNIRSFYICCTIVPRFRWCIGFSKRRHLPSTIKKVVENTMVPIRQVHESPIDCATTLDPQPESRPEVLVFPLTTVDQRITITSVPYGTTTPYLVYAGQGSWVYMPTRSRRCEGEELPKHHWRNPGRWQYSEEPEPEDLPA